MMKTILYLALILVTLTVLACNTPLVPPNQTMGSSTRHARAAMIKNPNAAEERPEAPEGMTSKTAEVVIENYKRNQKTAEQKDRNKVFGIEVDY